MTFGFIGRLPRIVEDGLVWLILTFLIWMGGFLKSETKFWLGSLAKKIN
jgi:uncharacterized RDD family membrane protein YckC